MPELTPRIGIKKPLGNENVTRQSFNENWDIIDNHTHQANRINVIDTDNLFAGADVEAVLKELFTSANSGKTAVANAVTAKGVAASPSDTFSTLATKIGQISTGKKFASGTVSYSSEQALYPDDNGNGITMYSVIVTGLSFAPSTVIIINGPYLTVLYPTQITGSNNSSTRINSSGTLFRLTAPANVANGSFTLPIAISAGLTSQWIAFE